MPRSRTTEKTMPSCTLTEVEELNWLALRLVPGLGTRKSAQLIERFKSPGTIFERSTSELEGAGLPGSIARSISSGCSFEDAALQHQKLKSFGAALVPIGDSRYPPRLREIFDPPIVLFVRGRVELLQSYMIAVVGTRRPTPYGNAVSERLSADLSRAGLTVVSGMARGIDTAAHKGVLAAGGNTIAVFGCGVDFLYPAENRRLYEQIAEKGCMISEFPMGNPAYPQNFPIRNRIVSGMSNGVLVVEGAQYSGSAITARLALEQGREVFAVPGNITSKASWGPNLLIKQGAKLVQDWNDVVLELPAEVRRRLISEGKQRLLLDGADLESSGQAPASELDRANREITRAVMGQLKVEAAIQLDDLLERLENHSSSELIATLFELEMLGLVKQLPGKNFVKVWGEG
ncbi:MAG: DNA-processing protein DprA [Acidobacteria bacterium]|nr:DNA-processing protein DprA [Acidobacteriota bacterium]